MGKPLIIDFTSLVDSGLFIFSLVFLCQFGKLPFLRNLPNSLNFKNLLTYHPIF